MKILMVNKFFHIVGGSERYFFDLSDLLRSHSHHVVPFSMMDKKNYPSEFRDYFVSNVDYKRESSAYRIKNSFRIVGKTIYSLESKKKIEKLILDTSPDLAHVHIISHQLSPSIFTSLKKRNVPAVQTLHEYKLICPNYKLYREKAQVLCEKCKKRKYYHAFLNKCLKNSYAGSLLACVAMYIHKLAKIYENNIDLFISPSKFLKEKMVEFGIAEEKIEFLPNFVNADSSAPHYGHKNYFIYIGRLSPEKGLFTLLKAMKKINSSKLLILGRGPLAESLIQYAAEERIQNVEFIGFVSGSKFESLIKNAMFVVLPSEWYENCPMVVLEALAWGKPTIGSNLGGIPDLVEDGNTGFLFEPGNSDDLAEKMGHLIKHPEVIIKLGMEARKKYENEYDPEVHYNRLMSIYKRVKSGRT